MMTKCAWEDDDCPDEAIRNQLFCAKHKAVPKLGLNARTYDYRELNESINFPAPPRTRDDPDE